MDKKDIIKRIFEEGLLVSPKILDEINETNIENILKKAKKNGTKNIENLDFLQQTTKPTEPVESALEIMVRGSNKKQRLTPKDFAEFYNKKYEGIKEILLSKMDVISINNTKKAFSDVSVIGIIKEINPQGFVLEDTTGDISVISKETGLSEDDVIGVTGHVREGKLFENTITYPDIPLNRNICKINSTIALTTRINSEMKKTDHIITLDQNQKPDEKITVLKSNPSWIEISKDSEKIIITHFNFPNEINPEEATQWLKKRHLPNNKKIDSPENIFLLKPVPDILWVTSSSKWTKIYKGVIIISITERDAVKINLENKQIEFTDNI